MKIIKKKKRKKGRKLFKIQGIKQFPGKRRIGEISMVRSNKIP